MAVLQAHASPSRAEHAAEEIRRAIREGRYPPGTRLVERRLAAELGTSHIPVREALARLVDEGLVERQPHRGARVAGLDERQLEELTSLRTTLEQLAVARVQERLTSRDEQELRRIVAQMKQAAERADAGRFLELDRAFHERLWEMSDHALLLGVSTQLRARIDAFLHAVTLRMDHDTLRSQAQAHVALLDAICGGDRDTAQAAVAEHIAIAADRLRAMGTPPA